MAYVPYCSSLWALHIQKYAAHAVPRYKYEQHTVSSSSVCTHTKPVVVFRWHCLPKTISVTVSNSEFLPSFSWLCCFRQSLRTVFKTVSAQFLMVQWEQCVSACTAAYMTMNVNKYSDLFMSGHCAEMDAYGYLYTAKKTHSWPVPADSRLGMQGYFIGFRPRTTTISPNFLLRFMYNSWLPYQCVWVCCFQAKLVFGLFSPLHEQTLSTDKTI